MDGQRNVGGAAMARAAPGRPRQLQEPGHGLQAWPIFISKIEGYNLHDQEHLTFSNFQPTRRLSPRPGNGPGPQGAGRAGLAEACSGLPQIYGSMLFGSGDPAPGTPPDLRTRAGNARVLAVMPRGAFKTRVRQPCFESCLTSADDPFGLRKGDSAGACRFQVRLGLAQ